MLHSTSFGSARSGMRHLPIVRFGSVRCTVCWYTGFVMEKDFVYCALRSEFLNVFQVNVRLLKD